MFAIHSFPAPLTGCVPTICGEEEVRRARFYCLSSFIYSAGSWVLHQLCTQRVMLLTIHISGEKYSGYWHQWFLLPCTHSSFWLSLEKPCFSTLSPFISSEAYLIREPVSLLLWLFRGKHTDQAQPHRQDSRTCLWLSGSGTFFCWTWHRANVHLDQWGAPCSDNTEEESEESRGLGLVTDLGPLTSRLKRMSVFIL